MPSTAAVDRRGVASRGARRKASFAISGLIGLTVSFGSLYLLIDILRWQRSAAYAVQTVLALETNFVLNSRYTWSDRDVGSFPRQWLRFHSVRFGIMVPVNQVNFFLLQPHVGTILANCLCIGSATIVNWFINDRWVFKARSPAGHGQILRGEST